MSRRVRAPLAFRAPLVARIALGASLVTVACSAEPATDVAGDVAGETDTTVPNTGPSDDLAPSQLTAPTVPPPETPPPCDPSVLAIWTAQVMVADGFADAVLRVRNDGASWCEVDVSRSPSVDPEMEPDVWLDPGGWADLVIGESGFGDECTDPGALRIARIDANGAALDVDTAVVSCEPQLVAFYPNETSEETCELVTAAVVVGAVVMRNEGPACRLGTVVSVDGEAVDLDSVGPRLATPVLARGDVVSLDLSVAGECSLRPAEFAFDTGVVVTVAVAGCTATIESPVPQPWIGGPGSPTSTEPVPLLLELDPFGASL